MHPLQILAGLPTEPYDQPISIIATPEELIEVKRAGEPARGIDCALLPDAALEEMPVLAELRRLLASRQTARRARKGRP